MHRTSREEYFSVPAIASRAPLDVTHLDALDLTVLVLSVATALLPTLIPPLRRAPVLPIPVFESGRLGLAACGKF